VHASLVFDSALDSCSLAKQQVINMVKKNDATFIFDVLLEIEIADFWLQNRQES
jgi:hypothetical protein